MKCPNCIDAEAKEQLADMPVALCDACNERARRGEVVRISAPPPLPDNAMSFTQAEMVYGQPELARRLADGRLKHLSGWNAVYEP